MPIRTTPQTALIVFTVLMTLITLGFLFWWLISERKKGPALLMLLIGGGISGLMESWLDNIILVGWPVDQNLPTFIAYERFVPMFVFIGYAWFCGGLHYVLARVFERWYSTKVIWLLYLGVLVVDFTAIGLSGWLGIIQFYGDGPMMIAGFPVWWAAIDGLNVTLGGTLTFFLYRRLKGAQQLWLILLPCAGLGAAAGIVGWPIATALNSGWSMPMKYLFAFIAIGFSLASVHLIAKVGPRFNELLKASEAQEAAETESRDPELVVGKQELV
ncbi:hypothetical protein AAFP30_28565 [Gordonia sp. CPCC 205515]|uniref:hypothetical protein n=1 Tax=Gordonia sp. CPCC 205515 TaxID=3140791 RepID=UPI003AF3AF53